MTTLTIFSAPKPFSDPHIALIQRNAIRSWHALGADVEVLLLGEEDGLAEAAAELGVRHIPDIRRNDSGTPLISSMIELARRESHSDWLVLINADIILLPGFVESVRQVAEQTPQFLILGHRWDLFVHQPIACEGNWAEALLEQARNDGRLHKSKGSDYFVFPRGQFEHFPEFAIGRAGWDNWTIYYARSQGWAVVDATHDIPIIHQQHDYAHLPGGRIHYTHPESDENLRLAGGKRFIFTLLDADRVLVDGRLLPYPGSNAKLWRDFETWPVLHNRNKFWMDAAFYFTHPIKFIRQKLPWLARILGIPSRAEPED
jgi:hypothetical protein